MIFLDSAVFAKILFPGYISDNCNGRDIPLLLLWKRVVNSGKSRK